MKRSLNEFAPGQYLLTLSPGQLAEVIGEQTAINTEDMLCRISPTAPDKLELWLQTKGEKDYTLFTLSYPGDWKPYTVNAVYEDNDQAYMQSVLATSKDQAIEVAQQIAYYGNHGQDADPEEFYNMLDADEFDVVKGYGEEVAPVTIRNASKWPEQVGYLVAYVATTERYKDMFLADNGPFGEEPTTDGYRRLSAAAVEFLNELSADAANYLQDTDANRFYEEFFAKKHVML